MDISIQAYRSCIGSFLPKNNRTVAQTYPTKFEERKPTENVLARKLFLQLMSLFFLILCSVTYFSSITSSNQSYTHPFYPTPQLFVKIQNYPASSDQTTDQAAKFILKFGINVLASFKGRMITNFSSRYSNGNRRAGGIKISHWNKGPGFLQNKMPEVKNIINGLHPHIIGLSEANLKINHDQNQVQLEDYVLHTCPTLGNPNLNTSRIVVYTHKSLVVKLRQDLMCDSYSSIWLEVGLPRHKKFIVGQTYREWQLPNQADRSSLAVTEQLARWTVFLEQWERALNSGMEVHLLGDHNLNHCNWTDLTLPATNQTSRLRSLITALFTQILPHGVSQCVVGPTRHWPDQVAAGLDHY